MKLEDFIKEHRDEFSSATFSSNHRDVMLTRLQDGNNRRAAIRRFVVGFSVAAAVVAVMLMVVVPSTDTEPSVSNATAIELAELNNYHNIQRQQSIQTIEELLTDKDAAMQVEIRNQIKDIERETTQDKLPQMLLTIDIDQYLALTVQRYEMENENLQTLINILNK